MGRTADSKIGFWAILILAVLNVALVGLLWYEYSTKPPTQSDFSKAERDARFAEELGLNDQQADSVIILRGEHFRIIDSIRFEISQLSRMMTEELFAEIPDTALVRRLSDKIGQGQAELERQTYDHFSLIKQMCQPEQYEQLKRLIFDAIRQKQPPPPPGEHRPPPLDGRPPPPGMPGAPPTDDKNRPTPPGGR